jgi:hypothetical protein
MKISPKTASFSVATLLAGGGVAVAILVPAVGVIIGALMLGAALLTVAIGYRHEIGRFLRTLFAPGTDPEILQEAQTHHAPKEENQPFFQAVTQLSQERFLGTKATSAVLEAIQLDHPASKFKYLISSDYDAQFLSNVQKAVRNAKAERGCVAIQLIFNGRINHTTMLFVDCRGEEPAVHFYDSHGEGLCTNRRLKGNATVTTEDIRNTIQDSLGTGLRIVCNGQRHQDDLNNCGVYSLTYVLLRVQGMDHGEACKELQNGDPCVGASKPKSSPVQFRWKL